MNKLKMLKAITTILVFIAFYNSSYAIESRTEKFKDKSANIDSRMKELKNSSKYNEKIENYTMAAADDILGEWHLFLNDGQDHGTLIIKKTGDTFYAELFGTNHWKGIGYLYDNKLLMTFKYTNEKDAGYVTFELLKKGKLLSTSINADSTFRWRGCFTKNSSEIKSPK